ncbi:MAG: alpha/beta hydrolase, partial [Acidimicrobiales bacterium]
DRLAVGGDSAGGNLAAVTALIARDRNSPAIHFQLLVYPVVDLVGSYPSVRENAEGYFLTQSAMEWFHGHYLPAEGADPQDPLASPIYAGDLAGLPPALVITAEFDPLRDEGEAYAERLRQAGVVVTTSRYDGMIHGFFSMTAITDRAKEAEAEAAAALRRALAPAD